MYIHRYCILLRHHGTEHGSLLVVKAKNEVWGNFGSQIWIFFLFVFLPL